MLSTQYLVNCLEEDHVCHGITTQEPRLSILDIIQLGASRNDKPPEPAHTRGRFGQSAPRQQSTEGARTPNSDEEQRLNRRQRCTLSHLRPGHCHLLHDHCGASPQDVRHLCACNAHPNDLSPEDLWQNPVASIRALNYLDDRNLDCLDDGPSSGKQQQQQQHDKKKKLSKQYHCYLCVWCIFYLVTLKSPKKYLVH